MRSIILFVSLLVSFPVFGISFYDIEPEVLQGEKAMQGHWRSDKFWEGTLCYGHSAYDIYLSGKIGKLEMEVEDPGAASVEADIVDVGADLFGAYKTQGLLCIPFNAGLQIEVDRIRVVATAKLVEEEGIPKIYVNIIHTRFYGVRLFKSVSPKFEEFTTRILNAAFNRIWDSKLGTWLEKKLSEKINKNTK